MKGIFRNSLLVLASGLLLATAGCVSGGADDPAGPDVELQVTITESPAVTCQEQGGIDQFTMTEWSIAYTNVPKNSNAVTSPWNDIEIVSNTISYDFPYSPITLPDWYPPTPGTVAAGSTQAIKHYPMPMEYFDVPGIDGTTAVLTMTIRAKTVDNVPIVKVIGEELHIEDCRPSG